MLLKEVVWTRESMTNANGFAIRNTQTGFKGGFVLRSAVLKAGKGEAEWSLSQQPGLLEMQLLETCENIERRGALLGIVKLYVFGAGR